MKCVTNTFVFVSITGYIRYACAKCKKDVQMTLKKLFSTCISEY